MPLYVVISASSHCREKRGVALQLKGNSDVPECRGNFAATSYHDAAIIHWQNHMCNRICAVSQKVLIMHCHSDFDYFAGEIRWVEQKGLTAAVEVDSQQRKGLFDCEYHDLPHQKTGIQLHHLHHITQICDGHMQNNQPGSSVWVCSKQSVATCYLGQRSTSNTQSIRQPPT